MRIKYYLRGIGCGIIFSVVIMSIAMGNRGKTQISDAEVIQRAKQLGMVEADDKGKEDKNNLEAATEIETEEDVKGETPASTEKNTEIDKASVNEKNGTEKDKDKDNEKDNDNDNGSINALTNQKPSSESNKSDGDTEKKPKEENNSNQAVPSDKSSTQTEYVSFTVKSGQVCRQIAENLQKKGIVDDADSFREYMARKGLASSIRCGTFELPKGATYEKIAECLTTR